MFRFSIRDVLWLTVVVAVAVGWWIELRSATRAASLLRKSEQANRDIEKYAGYLFEKLAETAIALAKEKGEDVYVDGDSVGLVASPGGTFTQVQKR
jgi:hypothetical protein